MTLLAPTPLTSAEPLPGAWRDAIVLALAVQFAVWGLGSILFLTNLHYDTLELIYWGRDWTLGYGKHPPLGTWIVDLTQRIGALPIVSVLVLGQLTVSVSAALIWLTVRLMASPRAAAFAVIVYLASPASTYFSVQVNHNSLLMPFWCATLYCAMRFFIRQDRISGAWMGLAAALAMLVKYEVVFLFGTLFVLAVTEQKFRSVFRCQGAWIGLFVFSIVLGPHIWWLVSHDWSVLIYAVDAMRTSGWYGLLKTANDVVVGQAALLIGPVLIYVIGRWIGVRFIHRDASWLPLILAFGPSAFMLLGALLTQQDPRQGWTIPFAPNIASAVAIAFTVETTRPQDSLPSVWGYRAALLSVAQFILFVGFLMGRDAFGHPVIAYELQSRKLAEMVTEAWEDHHEGPLRCLVIAQGSVAASVVLWLDDRPNFVDLSSNYWARLEQIQSCGSVGAVAISTGAADDIKIRRAFPNSCPDAKRVMIPTHFGGLSSRVPVSLTYVPPLAEKGACAERD